MGVAGVWRRLSGGTLCMWGEGCERVQANCRHKSKAHGAADLSSLMILLCWKSSDKQSV